METTTHFLKKAKQYDLVKFQHSVNFDQLKQTHLPFSGSLRHHPDDENKVILLSEPYGGNFTYYEFKTEDIGFVEKLPNVVNIDGEDIAMVMLWIKKGCIGIRSTPFIVESFE
jgi:inorganic pyrophosphatase